MQYSLKILFFPCKVAPRTRRLPVFGDNKVMQTDSAERQNLPGSRIYSLHSESPYFIQNYSQLRNLQMVKLPLHYQFYDSKRKIEFLKRKKGITGL